MVLNKTLTSAGYSASLSCLIGFISPPKPPQGHISSYDCSGNSALVWFARFLLWKAVLFYRTTCKACCYWRYETTENQRSLLTGTFPCINQSDFWRIIVFWGLWGVIWSFWAIDLPLTSAFSCVCTVFASYWGWGLEKGVVWGERHCLFCWQGFGSISSIPSWIILSG